MAIDFILPPAIKTAVERLLAAIEASSSVSQAKENGTRAEGFVLGLETVRSITQAPIEALYVLFDETTEKRLKAIADAG